VKDKQTGKMGLSKAAKNYHPGQGVYRSAYKNAMRLMRTEVNRAYRRAEWESYQSDPFIIGYRVVLSNNHTTLINGKRVPLVDICDELQGEYPKSFLFEGWHPQCRCAMLPILINSKELGEYTRLQSSGKESEFKSKREIRDVPENFKKWIDKNKARIAVAQENDKLPYWMKDNKKYLEPALKEIPAQLEAIKESIQKYNSYSNEWGKAYFDKNSGGYNVYHEKHNFSKKGSGGDAEKIVGKMLAKYNGKRV
jgi:hypothetical protein